MVGVELHAGDEFAAGGRGEVAAGKVQKTGEHIAVLGIAVVALDGLVDQAPHRVGAVGRRLAVRREKLEGRQAHRRGRLVEKRRLGAVAGAPDLVGMATGEARQDVEHLPARLRLGTVERLDQLVDIGHEQLGILCRNQIDLVRGLLAHAATGAAEVGDVPLEEDFFFCHLTHPFYTHAPPRVRGRETYLPAYAGPYSLKPSTTTVPLLGSVWISRKPSLAASRRRLVKDR